MKSFSFNGCKAGDVISRTNSNLFEKATIIIPTELGVIRNGTADKQYICFQTYKQLKEEGWTFEEVKERDNQNAKKKFEEWIFKKMNISGDTDTILFIAHTVREYALREAIEACTDDNSRENIKNLI